MQTLRPAIAFLLGLCCASALAQTFPTRPITIIVPFSVGTPQDILSRTAGKAMGERLSTTVVVDNRPGASGSIGNSLGARATPDGHTLLMTSTSFIISKALNPSFPYEPLKQYTPISLLSTGDMGLYVSTGKPIESLQDFLRMAKAKPGGLTYGTPGNGTPQHMAMELFKIEAGIDVLHIPYKENAAALTGLVSAQSDAMISPLTGQTLAIVKAGKARLISVLTEQRVPFLPGVPTLRENGYSNVDVHVWYGLLGPAGIPAPVQARLNSEIVSAIRQPDVRGIFEKQGLRVEGGPPEQLMALMRSETERWNRVVKTAGLKPD